MATGFSRSQLTPAQIASINQIPTIQTNVSNLQADTAGQTVDQLPAASSVADTDLFYTRQGTSPNYTDSSVTMALLRSTALVNFGPNVSDRINATILTTDGTLTRSYDNTAKTLTLGVNPSAVGGVFKLPLSANSPISANYSAAPTDAGTIMSVTTGGSDLTITLPTSGITVGTTFGITKNDTGAGKVVVTDGSNALAWLPTQLDSVLFRWNGSNFRVVSKAIAPWYQIITASTTWIKPPLLSHIDITLFGPGGSAGSGRRGAAGSARFGGGAGGRGDFKRRVLSTSMLASSITLTIGTAGTPGAAVTSDSTNGTAGATGTDTAFGTLLKAIAGLPGSGGTTTSGTGSFNASYIVEMSLGTIGGGSSSATAIPTGPANDYIGNGGAGGGISTGDVSYAGGYASNGSLTSFTPVTYNTVRGTAGSGTTAGGNAPLANSVTDPTSQYGASGGGGGGGGGSGSVAGNGADGGVPGGGAGGGGASFNGFTSGAGGMGGRGEARIIHFFS